MYQRCDSFCPEAATLPLRPCFVVLANQRRTNYPWLLFPKGPSSCSHSPQQRRTSTSIRRCEPDEQALRSRQFSKQTRHGYSLGAVASIPHTHGICGRRGVLLGREKGGVYKKKLNVFGGKVNLGEPPVEALIREVAEEMCVKVTLRVLDRCGVDAQVVAYQGKKHGLESCMLLGFVHIKGISCKAWEDVVEASRRQHASGSLLEMSQVSHVPVDDLGTRHDLSSYLTDKSAASIRQCNY